MCLAIFISWLFIFMIGVSRKCLANNMCQLTLMTSAQNVSKLCQRGVQVVSKRCLSWNFFFNCDPVELCWHMLKVCMTSIMSFKSLTRSTNKGVNVSWEALTSLWNVLACQTLIRHDTCHARLRHVLNWTPLKCQPCRN